MKDSFIQFMRSEESEHLLRHPNCFALLSLIAQRARREVPLINPHGLGQGEAMIGDCEAVGLTRQSYRTALANLQKWGLVSVRTTKKGTIAKLANTSIYNINVIQNTNHQPTINLTKNQPSTQPSTNHQPNHQPNHLNKQESIYDSVSYEKKNEITNHQPNHQPNQKPTINPTINQPSTQPKPNQITTTNNNDKNKRKEETILVGSAPASPEPVSVEVSTPDLKAVQRTVSTGRENGALSFEAFWLLYDKKVGSKTTLKTKWDRLAEDTRRKIIEGLPAYKAGISDRKYQPDPQTFLNQKRWDNETYGLSPAHTGTNGSGQKLQYNLQDRIRQQNQRENYF